MTFEEIFIFHTIFFYSFQILKTYSNYRITSNQRLFTNMDNNTYVNYDECNKSVYLL